ncbi:MAG: DUF1802 family protein [Thermoplasmata archaeon]
MAQAQKSLRTDLKAALKEWAVTIRALEQGDQILLLRKGGIAEKGRRFEPLHEDFLLFPTFEHQHQESLRTEFHPLLAETLQYPRKDAKVPISSWAHVERGLPVKAIEPVLDLSKEYIWSETEVKRRYDWKPERPLYLLFLRVRRLPETREVDLRKQYGGCRSWVELTETVSTEGGHPVLDDEAFASRMRMIEERIGG